MTQAVAGEIEAIRALDEARAALKEVRRDTTESLMKELRKHCRGIDDATPISPCDSNFIADDLRELKDADDNHLTTKSEEELITLSKVVEANLSSEHHEKTVSVLSMPERRITPEQISNTIDLPCSTSPVKEESSLSSPTTDHSKKKWFNLRKFFAKLKPNKNS